MIALRFEVARRWWDQRSVRFIEVLKRCPVLAEPLVAAFESSDACSGAVAFGSWSANVSNLSRMVWTRMSRHSVPGSISSSRGRVTRLRAALREAVGTVPAHWRYVCGFWVDG